MVQVKRLAKVLGWFVLGIIVLLGIAYGVLLFYQEPVRATVERQLNSHVQGYHFTLGKAHVYPNLSLDLINLLIVQTEHPDPPVATIPKWHFSVQWQHIFSGVVVSDYLIEHPTLTSLCRRLKKRSRTWTWCRSIKKDGGTPSIHST